MQNDEELRKRFEALAKEDAAAAPAFSQERIGHAATVRAPRRRSSFRSLAGVAVSIAAVVVALVLGMAWGTNTGYASARVEGQRERSDLAASTLGAASQLTVLRLDLARTRAELERQAKAGGSSSAAVQSASDQLRTIDATVARIEAALSRGESARPTSQTIPAGEIPMKRALAMTCSALSIASSAVGAQNNVRILELAPATVKSPTSFGVLLDVRDVGGGRIIVNDGIRHRLLLMDSSLKTLAVPFDSTPGNSNSYGPRPIPVVRYLGDSLMSSDMNAGTMLVMSPSGQVVRAIAKPVEDYPYTLPSHGTAFDAKGRMVFQGWNKPDYGAVGRMSDAQRVAQKGDSLPILRADLGARRIDTLGIVQTGGVTKLMGRLTPDGPVRFSVLPIENVDEWALLSDGSFAIVRGHDYHIDWIDPDGTRHSTTKLPFDWKRLTDEDKQKLIDSTREAASASIGRAFGRPAPAAQSDAPQQPGARRFVPADPNAPRGPSAPVQYLAPELKDLPDYYPPIRMNALMPDLDGNLWILPTSSAQSKSGELIYDVVNAKGDFHRVRMPVGKSIAGFGKGGVVFLQSGDRTNGFYLERTKVPK